MGQVFIDSTPVDDQAPYYLGWNQTKFGKAEFREPSIVQTVGGVFAVDPLSTAFKERRGAIAVYAQAIDNLDKWRLESDIRALLTGKKKIHRGSRYLNVSLLGADETDDDAAKAPGIAGARADFVAADPFWYLNQPLNGLGTPVNVGDEWQIYDDNGIPGIIPPFIFSTNTFTINNWGNAPAFAAGTVINGPTGPTSIYLKGNGTDRLEIPIDAFENGVFFALSEFTLDPGNNVIRVENAAGSLITPPVGFAINFGDTYMRFH